MYPRVTPRPLGFRMQLVEFSFTTFDDMQSGSSNQVLSQIGPVLDSQNEHSLVPTLYPQQTTCSIFWASRTRPHIVWMRPTKHIFPNRLDSKLKELATPMAIRSQVQSPMVWASAMQFYPTRRATSSIITTTPVSTPQRQLLQHGRTMMT